MEAPATTEAPIAPSTLDPNPKRLENQELLTYLAQSPDLKERDAIIGAGYYKLTDGQPRVNRTAYFKAISAANGYVPAKPERQARGPIVPRGLLKVGPNGMIPVGGAYSRLLVLAAGTYVSVYEDNGVLVIDPTTDEAKAKTLEEAAKPPKPAKAEPAENAIKPKSKTPKADPAAA
jgi:hypothetical protein